jgi:hypothetical protein
MAIGRTASLIAQFLEDIGVSLDDSIPPRNLLYDNTLADLTATYRSNRTIWDNDATTIEGIVGAVLHPPPAPVPTTQPVGPESPRGTFKLTDAEQRARFTAQTPRGPADLTRVAGIGLGGSTVVTSVKMAGRLRVMIQEAKAAGHHLVVNNSYRNYDPRQSNAAQGGRSNHRVGEAVDFDMVQSSGGALAWAHANAFIYGLYNKLWKPGMAKTPGAEYNHFSLNGF